MLLSRARARRVDAFSKLPSLSFQNLRFIFRSDVIFRWSSTTSRFEVKSFGGNIRAYGGERKN